MADGKLACPYCNRDNFASPRGLKQHQISSKQCYQKLSADLGCGNGKIPAAKILECSTIAYPQKRPSDGKMLSQLGPTAKKLRTMAQPYDADDSYDYIDTTLCPP